MIDFIQALTLREEVRDPNAPSTSSPPPKESTIPDFLELHPDIFHGENFREVIDRADV